MEATATASTRRQPSIYILRSIYMHHRRKRENIFLSIDHSLPAGQKGSRCVGINLRKKSAPCFPLYFHSPPCIAAAAAAAVLGSCRPVKAKILGVAAACGAVAAASRTALVPGGVLALLSTALLLSQGGVLKDGANAPDLDQVESGAA